MQTKITQPSGYEVILFDWPVDFDGTVTVTETITVLGKVSERAGSMSVTAAANYLAAMLDQGYRATGAAAPAVDAYGYAYFADDYGDN